MTLCVCQTDTMLVLTHSVQQQIKGTEIDSGTLDGGEGEDLQHLQSQPRHKSWATHRHGRLTMVQTSPACMPWEKLVDTGQELTF